MVDWQQKCRCGHFRYEHHPSFGCMHWDQRRPRGWCDCDGFAASMADQMFAARSANGIKGAYR